MSCCDLLRVSQMFRVVVFFPGVIYRRGLIGPYPIKPDVQVAHFPATTGVSPQQRVSHFPATMGVDPQQRRLPATTGDEKMPRAAGYLFVFAPNRRYCFNQGPPRQRVKKGR